MSGLSSIWILITASCLLMMCASVHAADLRMEVIDTVKVHPRTGGSRQLRSSEYGVTLSVVDPSDPARTIIHVYTRGAIQRRRLPLFRVQQSALHRDTLYCAMYNSASAGSLAIVTPDDSIRSTYIEPKRAFIQSQATSVTVVDGNVAVSDEKYGILILKQGDDTLRFCDRKGNSWMNIDLRECFFLRDTTYWINQELREISFDTGGRTITDVGMGGNGQITVVDDSVRWMDVHGRCHSHSMHSDGRSTWIIDTTLTTGCVGRHGVMSEVYEPASRTYRTIYRSFAGTTYNVILPHDFDPTMYVTYMPVGWYDGGFYQAVRVDDSTMIVLRLKEPDSSSTSIPDVAQRTTMRHDARCMSISEARLLFEDVRRADPAAYCVDLFGSRIDSFPVAAGPVIIVSSNQTRVVLVLPW